ncbi:GNAT family N-acetyltransferase [Chengkuizengella axinellae]|uniref:GNAT family protein n=1 Tax=Chengkuizengella axinellae TaxID=3064388 RepID=A0ABT9J3N5_9BACL|nr:GNAT family protein [Chengkuizengella sp. 2205SS18-9]MDP5276215.1 GNAT family protein [Chengkuizengella sp. 2205SS18-9]
MFSYKIEDDLYLKLIELKDAEKIFHLIDQSRDHLRKWLGWVDMTIFEDDYKRIVEQSLVQFAENKSIDTVIIYKDKYVGKAAFNKIDPSIKQVTLAYWLGNEYQGKGIITKVVKSLTDYAIHEMNMNRVEIRVAKENKKSRAVPERLDFVQEGCIRRAEWLYDHYVDHTVYSMLAEDWMK